jgi:hypothetical protein
VRWTLSYRFTDRAQAGIEYNPLDHDIGPLVNLTLMTENEWRPALIAGTSSDRIGSDHGQSYYGTLSKSLEPWIGLPVAPYVGAAFRSADDDWEPVAGLHYELFDTLSVTHLWDGENLHLTVDYPWRNWVVGVVLAQQGEDRGGEGHPKEYFLGLSLGVRLPGFFSFDSE